MKNKCPECKSELIAFCGLKANGLGEYENLWECENCGHKWTTEINKITRNEFSG